MKKILVAFLLLNVFKADAQRKTIDQKVDSVLNLMTLQEKVGQLNQYSGSNVTGPADSRNIDVLQEIRNGNLGSMLNVKGAKITREIQQEAMKSRLKIPLIFGLDVVHGYRVTFPIPLAEAASWDLDAIELSARVAARESAAAGLHWTFAPMVDISRDPRWGRVMEGAGEDTYLGSQIAKARVNGFQGKSLGDLTSVMACVKHFAAYGAAVAGRDYNSVDMSLRQLWEVYLPPFKAAADAGAATFMNSFNDINGIPATASSYLQRDILKEKWGFKGFVVSDWGSINEMVAHGYASDGKEASKMALNAGSDMDMESKVYQQYLVELVKEGKVSLAHINDAVSRILKKKFELGLFDDPFRFSDEKRERKELNSVANRNAARDVAKKSIILLKNQTDILPISKSVKKIALIGPLAKSNTDMKGFWSVDWGKEDHLVSPYEGIKNKLGNDAKILYAKGCNINDTLTTGIAEAIKTAEAADVVVLAVGENFDMSGEAKSRSNINLPGVQEKLIKAVLATGKPVVVMIMAGRPLVFNYTADHAQSILYTWWLGSEAGNAMADVLFGDYNPSAKVPMTFPRAIGQIPVYYNHYSTGRPFVEGQSPSYRSTYLDISNAPQYAFGHGLSYTSFKYSNLQLSTKKIHSNDGIKVTMELTNSGKKDGEEVVQLYLKDVVAQPIRPVIELKDFKKVFLKTGETKKISFLIEREKLSFYNQDLEWIVQPGAFKLMIGSASDDIRLADDFELID